MNDSIEDAVLGIMAGHMDLEREKMTPATPLQDLGVDSLKMVEIMFELEERFDINIPDPENVGQQEQQFRTAADVVNVVKGLIEDRKNTP